MFGGFMRGIVGTALAGIAAILIAGGAWFAGQYLRYASRQTVKAQG